MNKNIVCGVLILLLYQSTFAQNEFTHYVPNALATGYGGSVLTYTDNPAIVYWNPGGIAFATNDKILININNPFSFNYISFSKFFPPKNSIGFSLSRLTKNDSLLDVVSAAYSYRISQFFAIGGNINYGRIHNADDYFVTTSIGCLLKPAINRYSFYQAGNSPFQLFVNPTLYDKFALGFVIHNIPLDKSSTMHEIRIGSAFKFSNWGPTLNIGHHIHRGEDTTHLGFGFNISTKFHFYSGLVNFDFGTLAFGGSISLGILDADVVYSTQTEKITISISMRFKEEAKFLAKKFIDQGTKMIRENDFRGALNEFEKSLSYNQNNERIIFLTNVLNKRIENENLKIDSLLHQAIDFQKKGWNVNATLVYKQILEIDHTNKNAIKNIKVLRPYVTRYINRRYQYAKKYFQKKNLEKAKALFKEILQFEDKHEGALKYLAKIDSVSSYLSNEYYYRGLGYYKRRFLEKAKTAFERVLEMNPKHGEAKYYLDKINHELDSNKLLIERLFDEAFLLEKQGKYLLASTKYREILNINKDFEKAAKHLDLLQAYIKVIVNRKFKRAKNIFNKGNYPEAHAAFEDILSIDPNNKQAKRYLNRIRDIQLDKVEKHYRMAKQYIENKMWDDAIKECEQVLAIDPEHPDVKKMQEAIWTNISLEELQEKGLELFRKGEYVRALEVFKQIIEKDPNHVIATSYINESRIKLNKRIAALFNSGMRFYTIGNYEAAIREWNRILAIDPNYESAIEYKKRAQERLEALEKLP